jgi:hypothetical protein
MQMQEDTSSPALHDTSSGVAEARPVFVSAFSILHFFVAIFYGLLLLARRHAIYVSLLSLMPFVYFVFLSSGSAIGMWKGRRWGWWLGTLLYAAWTVTGIIQILTFAKILPTGTPMAIDSYQYRYHVIFAALAAYQIVIWCFLREGVLRYFALQGGSKLSAVAKIAAITACVFFVMWIVR